ncbi:GNAT family N-acetyltransferase [Teredinibacter sp. KSP-S5-2]|uniref:GNAT family N-acetyltransferase n=1 Tax=Teredinibacter sp. KSP-S5-2 TaxID=3034506 RepID=UPI002935057B|nr:GNAT family N-acetyltransferase [Teredinibacter sp. KSP-S5-2]WNO09678.1 GNAT family N-acetyltransferase [Teredinibacter sp. KSP-S5-2]
MLIREASNKDSPLIKQLVFGVLNEYGLQPSPQSTDKDLDDIEQHYFSRGGYFGVAEENGQIIASFGLYKITHTTCELRKMYSLANQRGKGLGKQLMHYSLKKAKELGFSHVILETAAPLVEAIGLYKKFGFQKYKPEHLSSRCDQAFELWL